MYNSPTVRYGLLSWVISLLLPVAAWVASDFTLPYFHPAPGVFFTAAACLSALIGGVPLSLAAIALNVLGLNAFAYLQQTGASNTSNALWSALLITVALVIGYARQKWSAAEVLAGRLNSDLTRLRDELENQRADLKRFNDLSVRLSSNLEVQALLNDVLSSIASLQKTDLAMLLLLPSPSSKALRVETYIGFTPEQIKLFGDLPTTFFSTDRRVLVEDTDKHRERFPFRGAANEIGFRAVFSTPIVPARGDPLGVVVTFFRKPYSPGERQSRMVELYARQAANALDNARVYSNTLETLAAEQRRTALLRSLADASVQIHSSLELESLLQVITDQARNLIGARQAVTTLLPKGDWNSTLSCISVAEGQVPLNLPAESSEMFMLACNLNKPVRLGAGTRTNGRPWVPVRRAEDVTRYGWLAAPLLTRDNRNLGLIQLSQKLSGDFSQEDEAILVQLTHMASAAVDNVRLYREAQGQIAETKRVQEALERGKETMELAQKYVGIGIWEWDLQTGELAWSDEIRKLHGFSGDNFDGRYETWMDSIHSDDRREVHQSITNAITNNGEYEVQYRVVFADKGVHWLEARGRTILMAGVPVRVLGVAMEVTSRKMAEEALRQSEKLAATGRLAASIAHEINNPLAAVMNSLYILRTSPQLPKTALAHVKTAESELARVVHITRQTLGFYREIASPVMTSVPQLLEEVLAAYDAKIAHKGATVNRELNAVDSLAAFPGELRQVFSNLVLNAIEAIPMQGHLWVRVKQTRDREQQPGLQITIADDGPGIAAEHVPRIFEPFFTTKDNKGTGLGLWVSQGIVAKHGGKVQVHTRVDDVRHGTCFRVFLPFATVSERAANISAPAGRNFDRDAKAKSASGAGNDLSAA